MGFRSAYATGNEEKAARFTQRVKEGISKLGTGPQAECRRGHWKENGSLDKRRFPGIRFLLFVKAPGITVKSPATGAGLLVSIFLLLPIPVAVTLIGVSAIVSRPNTLRILVTVIVG